MNIVVLAGGYSPERDVSLSSGSLVANALVKTGHSVLLLDLYEGIEILSTYGIKTIMIDNSGDLNMNVSTITNKIIKSIK